MTRTDPKIKDEPNMAYSELGIDSSFVPALWHISRVSHLAEKELGRVGAAYGLSGADINVLGAIWNVESGVLRATDLADMLRVSNAVLSPRVARLERKGLLVKSPSAMDRRASELSLTPEGVKTIKSAFRDIGTDTKFVQHFFELSEEDQKALVRIMIKLHTQLFRNFSSRSRGK
jgi:DNA-binding MarR family transcriptional regulator